MFGGGGWGDVALVLSKTFQEKVKYCEGHSQLLVEFNSQNIQNPLNFTKYEADCFIFSYMIKRSDVQQLYLCQ